MVSNYFIFMLTHCFLKFFEAEYFKLVLIKRIHSGTLYQLAHIIVIIVIFSIFTNEKIEAKYNYGTGPR